MWRTSAEYPTKSRRSLVAVLTVFAVEIEEVDFGRPVGRILTVVEAMPMLFGTATRNPVLRPCRRCVRQYCDMGPHGHYCNIVAEFLTKNDNQKREKVNESSYEKHTGQERTMGISTHHVEDCKFNVIIELSGNESWIGQSCDVNFLVVNLVDEAARR